MSRLPLTPFRRAFTLIEVLTATTIMVVLLFLVLTIASNTFAGFDAAISKLTTGTDSRNVLGVLEQDLQSAIIRNDGNIWLQVDHPRNIDNVQKAFAPRLMLFAAAPDRPKREGSGGGRGELIGGDICAISYQIAHRSPFGTKDLVQQMYGLYRAIVDSKATFNEALPIIAGNGESESGAKPSDFWDGSAEVLDINGTRTRKELETWAIDQLNFQASNVVELKFVFWYYDTTKKSMVLLAHQDVSGDISALYRNAGVSKINVVSYSNELYFKAGKIYIDGTVSEGTLKRIDVFTTLLSPSGAKKLGGLQQTEGSVRVDEKAFKNLVEKEGYSFSTSITLAR